MKKLSVLRVTFLIVAACCLFFLPPASAGITWNDVRTITFDEYAEAPRSPDGYFLFDQWDPPEDWTYPFFHNKESYFSSVFQPYSWAGEPEPDLSAYAQWAGRVTTSGPTGDTPGSGLRPAVPRVNMRSLDITSPYLSGYRYDKEPLSVTIYGWREDVTAEPDSPERWKQMYSKTVELLPPTQTPVYVEEWGDRTRFQSQYTTVNLSGWNQLNRLTFELQEPGGTPPSWVAVDNIKASTGSTHGFFLGAPDEDKIISGKDTTVMVDAMKDAFGMQSYNRLVLPDVNTSTHTTASASEAIFSRLDNMKQRLKPGDNFVFYYSGHGVQVKDAENDLNPNNTNEALYLGANALLTDDALTNYFQQDPIWSQVDKVFILDACYSGGFWTSSQDTIALKGRENNLAGPTDLATLSRTALLAAAPEYRTALSFETSQAAEEMGLPGIENFGKGQGLLTSAVVSGLQLTEDGFTLADLNQDGLSFRELMEWVRVAPTNELYGTEAAPDDYFAARAYLRGRPSSNRDMNIPWFYRSQFRGYERDPEFDPWATEPIEAEWGAFAAASDDFGTAGLLEMMTEGEGDFRLQLHTTPGDYNNDGLVNDDDYLVWLANVGAPAGTLPNDITGVDIGMMQFQLWQMFTTATVPEPTTLGIALLAASVFATCRRVQHPASRS